jgi:hypothetical protein
MSTSPSEGFVEAKAQVPSCALDEDGVKAQQARHERLAPSVTGVSRTANAVIIGFAPGFDRQALDEVIAVERECCPMFAFAFDELQRQVMVTIEDPEQKAALDAIADAFGRARPG